MFMSYLDGSAAFLRTLSFFAIGRPLHQEYRPAQGIVSVDYGPRPMLARAFFSSRHGDAGDLFLASFDDPARAVRCAIAIRNAVHRLGIEVLAGLHTGERQVIGSKVGGLAVHIGARVAASAEPGEIVVSSTVKNWVAGSGIVFTDRGLHAPEGIPEDWRLFATDERTG
jgi:hypothetical protein